MMHIYQSENPLSEHAVPGIQSGHITHLFILTLKQLHPEP